MRLFIALDIPSEGKWTLIRLREEMRAALPGRYVGDSQFHITLHFLGETPTSSLPGLRALLDALADRVPFPLTVAGTGSFTSRDGHTAFARVNPSDSLAELVRTLNDALEAQGFPRETKPFRGHVTLGRAVKGGPPYPVYPPITFTADHITLYESRLGPGGPTYTPVHTVPLKP